MSSNVVTNSSRVKNKECIPFALRYNNFSLCAEEDFVIIDIFTSTAFQLVMNSLTISLY